jgi:hypothetical protein
MDDLILVLPPELAEVPLKDFLSAVRPMPLSDEEREAAAAVEAVIAEQSPDTFLGRVEAAIEADDALPAAKAGARRAVSRQALRTWWYFGQGLDAGAARQTREALRCYRRAAYGFALLGDRERLEETVEESMILEANEQIQGQNFTEGDRLLDAARRFLENSSRIGREQREKLVACEVESLFQQSGQAFRSGDPFKAEQLLRKAAERLDSLAKSHDKGSSDLDEALHRMYMGQAGLLRAQAAFLAASREIGLYDFDNLAPGESAAAEKAAELLAERSPPNAALAAYYAEVLGIYEQLATIMVKVLGSSFRSDRGEFHALHERVRQARVRVPAAAGANAGQLAQACDYLDQTLNNLERLAKPSKRDLGIAGGFVACAVFVVLLIALAVVNRLFGIGLSGGTMLASCAPLAVAAGFGLPGLKAWKGSGSSDITAQAG